MLVTENINRKETAFSGTGKGEGVKNSIWELDKKARNDSVPGRCAIFSFAGRLLGGVGDADVLAVEDGAGSRALTGVALRETLDDNRAAGWDGIAVLILVARCQIDTVAVSG